MKTEELMARMKEEAYLELLQEVVAEYPRISFEQLSEKQQDNDRNSKPNKKQK